MASKWLIAAEAGLAVRSLSQPRDNSDVSDNSPAGMGTERANVTNVTIVRPPEEKPTAHPHDERKGKTAFSGDVSALADNSSDDIERTAIIAEGAGSEPDWCALYTKWIREFLHHHDQQQAQGMAWELVAGLWHARHGERCPPGICGGCGAQIMAGDRLTFANGTETHIGAGDAGLACLIAYGARWRSAAGRALASFGIKCPEDTTK